MHYRISKTILHIFCVWKILHHHECGIIMCMAIEDEKFLWSGFKKPVSHSPTNLDFVWVVKLYLIILDLAPLGSFVFFWGLRVFFGGREEIHGRVEPLIYYIDIRFHFNWSNNSRWGIEVIHITLLWSLITKSLM